MIILDGLLNDNVFTLTGPPPMDVSPPAYEYETIVEEYSGLMVPFDPGMQKVLPEKFLDSCVIDGVRFAITVTRKPAGGTVL